MKHTSSGFWLDFRRVFSRRVSGNKLSLAMELLVQPFVVALLVFIAFLNRENVDPYRLNFLYFSTLYAFWIGLFGSCQAINSEVRNGEWCYWVLGMGRNRTTHVLAIGLSCLFFAAIQCLVFLGAVVLLSGIAGTCWCNGCHATACAESIFNHFTDMFVSVPNGNASVDPIYQMNGALWYVLAARWGSLGPVLFATGIFGLSLGAAMVSGTMFGLLFGSAFKDPATSLNMSVGFVVLLGMISFCGLRGSGDEEKVGVLFAPIRDFEPVYTNMMNRVDFPSNAVPAATLSYILPQRYFFNIGQITFDKDWSREPKVQSILRERLKIRQPSSTGTFSSNLIFKARWTNVMNGANFSDQCGIIPWINNWNKMPDFEMAKFRNWSEPKAFEMVQFLRRHREHRVGWNVGLHRKTLRLMILLELAPLLLIDILCLAGTLFAVWRKPCFQDLR